MARETDEHYAAIGRVAAHWSYFEWFVDRSAIELCGQNELFVSCFTSQITGHARKLDAYISVARLVGVSDSLASNLCKFSQKVARVAEQRNRAIHDVWLLISPKEKAARYEITARKKLRAELVMMPTAQVLNLAHEIEMLAATFSKLNAQARDEASLQ